MKWILANLFFQCCCLLGWYVNRRNLPARLSFIVIMVVITLLFELIAAYIWLALDENNLFIFHILVPIQYIFMTLPYYFSEQKLQIKKQMLYSILIVCVFAILFALTVQPVTIYNTYVQLMAYILLTMWSALYLWNLLNNDATILIERDPLFWISVGIIFYAVMNFVITGMLNYLIDYSLYWAKILYDVTTIIAFMMYSVFTFAFFSHKIFSIDYRKI